MVRVGWNEISGEGAFGAPRPQDRDPRQVTPGNGEQGAGPFVPSRGIPDNFFGFVMIALGMR